MAVLVVLAAFLGLAAPANADSLWDNNASCIHTPPSSWMVEPFAMRYRNPMDAWPVAPVWGSRPLKNASPAATAR